MGNKNKIIEFIKANLQQLSKRAEDFYLPEDSEEDKKKKLPIILIALGTAGTIGLGGYSIRKYINKIAKAEIVEENIMKETGLELKNGDIIEFSKDSNKEYIKLDKVFSEEFLSSNEEFAQIINNNVGLYLENDKVDLYNLYIAQTNVDFRSNPTIENDANIQTYMSKDDEVYVNESKNVVVDEDGNIWKNAIFFNQEDNKIYKGYVDVNVLLKSQDEKTIGKLNSDAVVYSEESIDFINNTKENNLGGSIEILNNNKENNDGLEYAVDFSDFTNFVNFKNLVDSGKLKSAIFSIGTTNQHYYDDGSFGQVIVGNDYALESDFNEISENYNQNNSTEFSQYFCIVRQNYADLLKMVDYAIQNGIVVGFSYNMSAMNMNEVSAEAAYYNSIYQKLSSDIEGFKEAKKLPPILLVNSAYTFDSPYIGVGNRDVLPEERGRYIEEFVKLLGNGTKTEGAWTIGDKKATEGYGVIDKNYILCEDINCTHYIDRLQVNEKLEKNGYSGYNWYSGHQEDEYHWINAYYENIDGCLNDSIILNNMVNNDSYVAHKNLVEQGDFFQVYVGQNIGCGDGNYSNYNINVAQKGIFEAMANQQKINGNILNLAENVSIEFVKPYVEDKNVDAVQKEAVQTEVVQEEAVPTEAVNVGVVQEDEYYNWGYENPIYNNIPDKKQDKAPEKGYIDVEINKEDIDMISKYIASWENPPLYNYLTGERNDYYDNIYVNSCITEDRKNYICYIDGLGIYGDNSARNYGFGVNINMMNYAGIREGNPDHKEILEDKYHYNLNDENLLIPGVSKLPVNVIDEAKQNYLKNRVDQVKECLKLNNIRFSKSEILALAAISYQCGPERISNLIENYAKWGNSKALRRNFQFEYNNPFEYAPGAVTDYKGYEISRGFSYWKAFHDGEFIFASGPVKVLCVDDEVRETKNELDDYEIE